MIKNLILTCLYVFFIFSAYGWSSEKSTSVKLELEKGTVIDASTIKDSSPFFAIARKSVKNNLILLVATKPSLKVYCFNSEGSLKTTFLSSGEGPGEVRSLRNFQILDNNVIVASDSKVIYFDLKGKMQKELKFHRRFNYCRFIDNDRYVCNFLEMDSSGNPISNLSLASLRGKKIISTICRNKNRNDIGVLMITINGIKQQTYHGMMTPDYKFSFLSGKQQFICCVSDSTVLQLKDTSGKTLKTINIPFEKRKVTPVIRDQFIDSLKRIRNNPNLYKAIVKKIPKYLLTIMNIAQLPNNHFALILCVGYEKYIVKIFDRNFKYLFDMEFPAKVLSRFGSLRRIRFYEKGFFGIVNSGDNNQYEEYVIKNLKTIFY